MSDFQEYSHTEVVRARKLKDEGETIVTTTHGGLAVFGGYLVYTKGGAAEYWETDKFADYYEAVTKAKK